MGWGSRPSLADAIPDHEHNPEYEVHVGQVMNDGSRMLSIWLQGEQWSGILYPTKYHQIN